MKIILLFILIIQGGEIPVTKLAALQKVLQSDFLNAVREVYEHIYDTIDVQVGNDRRMNSRGEKN